MPRTNLLSRLAMLAEAQRQARALGVDVPEVLGRCEEALVSDEGLTRWDLPLGNSNGETYSDTGYQEAWHATAGEPGRKGIINNYTGGDASRLLNPSKPFSDTSDPNPAVRGFVQNAARTFLSQIEPVFPGMTRKWTGKAQLSAWHVSPFQYGAYAYWTPGYMHRYSTYEAVPVGPVHFAGEHTSSNFQGYMEGAAEEGQRAANEIVDAY